MCARDKAVEALAPEATKAPVKIPRIVQYYRLKQKHLALRGGAPPRPVVQYSPDWLSLITSKSKTCLEFASTLYAKSGKSDLRSMLPSSRYMTNLTIPLVLSAILASLFAKEIYPEQEPRSRIWMLFYLIAFATHFGTQIWMTLVAGLVLYFNLPRHVFGQVQEVIFPFFYMFNATMSFIQIMAYINTQTQINLGSTEMVQIMVMTFTLCIELVIRLYISKALVLVKHQKTRIEAEAGTGQEIGHHVLGELANCPHYMGILRRFRRMHSYISLATIVTVICSAYHINYLTDKLCI